MIRAKCFEMYNMSLSMLFGKSPKIKYICGKCGKYNKTRISVNAVKLKAPYTRCQSCGVTNLIPIVIEN